MLFRLGVIYLFIAEDWSRLKIGYSKIPNSIYPRYKTSKGEDMVIYTWDLYWDSTHDWRKIETDIHDLFSLYRIYSKLELFKLYDNHGCNLLKYYRDKITSYFKSTEILKIVYEWGVMKRRVARSDTFPSVSETKGNVIRKAGCSYILADFGEEYLHECTVSDRKLTVKSCAEEALNLIKGVSDAEVEGGSSEDDGLGVNVVQDADDNHDNDNHDHGVDNFCGGGSSYTTPKTRISDLVTTLQTISTSTSQISSSSRVTSQIEARHKAITRSSLPLQSTQPKVCTLIIS